MVMVEGWLDDGWAKVKGIDLIIQHPCGRREGVKGLKLVQ